MRIVYCTLSADVFHYGHLQMLKFSKSHGDYLICGLITDKLFELWYGKLFSNYKERKEVIEAVKFVDEVIPQNKFDPSNNLADIYKRFGTKNKYIFIQSHQKWPQLPGVEFIEKIGGKAIIPPYYKKLTRERLKKVLIERKEIVDYNKEEVVLGNIHYPNEILSTKANTLKKLNQMLSKSIIEKLFIFTYLDWKEKKDIIIKIIQKKFNNTNVIIRSSCLNEDSITESNAGAFKSVQYIDVNNTELLKNVISEVFNSYRLKDKLNDKDQILVQKQTEDVIVSGVVFTRDLETNFPFYLINYDSETKRTDTVTSGSHSQTIRIKRDTGEELIPYPWNLLIESIKEIELFLPKLILDIEFAINKKNQVIIFQVRPLVSNLKINHDFDKYIDNDYKFVIKKIKKIKNKYNKGSFGFSDMSFWNPAEIIGNQPNFLDSSLYKFLVMRKSWNKSLIPIGYSPVNDNLMEVFFRKPYINLYYSFFSLTPNNINEKLKNKLIHYYFKKIKEKPCLHDKIEFEIVLNCYHFETDDMISSLIKQGFNNDEVNEIKKELIELTQLIMTNYKSILKKDNNRINKMNLNRNKIEKNLDINNYKNLIESIQQLLYQCEILGIEPFSRTARISFIVNQLIKSALNKNIISNKENEAFFDSIHTVAKEYDSDYRRFLQKTIDIKQFIYKYGHLRPNTYDITKLPYNKNIGYFENDTTNINICSEKYIFDKDKFSDKFSFGLKDLGLEMASEDIYHFFSSYIQIREKYKFEFTKSLSLAIELIVELGKFFGYNREEMAYLDIELILLAKKLSYFEVSELWRDIIKYRKDKYEKLFNLPLPAIFFSEKDFKIVREIETKPNFITQKKIISNIYLIEKQNKESNINNKIVLIEKADPGYDWIFTKNIGGLITCYGGVASHMAIRCAEFQLPAAIGCGEKLFKKLYKSKKVILNCKEKKIMVIK